MNNRTFIPCSEHALLAALTSEYVNLSAIIQTVRGLASFDGPVSTFANSLDPVSRDTAVAELDWRLPQLRLAETALRDEFERFQAHTAWPECLVRTVKVNTAGTAELLSKSAAAIAEAEETLRKEGPKADRRIEQRYRASQDKSAKAA